MINDLIHAFYRADIHTENKTDVIHVIFLILNK